ncbi:GNAT family N-acetyltransferase [Sphingobacterium yanglingense]|uniref:Ribosomal protein S18 acetylase RimI-like enzyme n=1 Tax=Sphingobacterium yanglingense TaxID=1437280 RepID=A0A4R6WLM3_9SPHI|nr:GNAT family N-acetyltransferase [Sphingobacterium yanglingense]TDQ79225.1 ribosomal protein S18 acetylase RimI-like enzyme [Sphingobacterium yanglingense]
MKNIIIKKASLADIAQLQKIGRETFSETFSESNSAENMKKYLEEGFSISKLSEELSNEHAAFYFAMRDNQVIGYLKINLGASQTELQDSHSLEIERIYVLAAYHGHKVGQLLFEKAMDIAHEKEVDYVWLGVWEENPRAIRFYLKNGFIEFDKHIFVLGDDRQTDIMMRKKIN